MSFSRAVKLAGFAVRYLGRMRQGRRGVLAHLASGDPGTLPMPTFVQFRVTNLCNLRCKMCGQWGDTGIYRPDGTPAATDGEAERSRIRELIGAKRQLALADWVRLLDELAPSRPVITLFGGEPLLYPEIVPLVREVKKRGLSCTMITNGGRLEETAADLVAAGIDTIAVSIDGTPAVHDAIRGQAGTFARAAAGVRAIARERDRSGSTVPLLLAIVPVTELNLDDYPAALKELGILPFDAIDVGLRWFIGRETGAAYEKVMGSELGSAGASWKGFDFDGPAFAAERREKLEELARFLERAGRRRFLDSTAGRPWTSFVPDVPPRSLPTWFEKPAETFGHDFCPVPWYFAQVEPDGDVCFCGDFPDYVIGSVRTSSFEEVWRGERATRFREKLAKEPLPVCSRCCGSYVYGKWKRPSLPARETP